MAKEIKPKRTGPLESIGDFFGGVGKHLSTGFAAVRDAERARLAQPGIQNEKAKAFVESEKIKNLIGRLQLEQGVVNDKRISDLALAAKRLSDVDATDASEAIVQRIRALQGKSDVKTEDETRADRDVLSKHFSTGVAQLKQEGGPGTLASDKQVDRLTKSFVSEAKKQGLDSRNAELLFNEFFDEEVGQRKGVFKGTFRDDVLPERKVLDNRGFFTAESFNELDGVGVADKTKTTKVGKAPAKDLSEFIQIGTEALPEDTTKKSLSQLGITVPGDQQTFQELEAQLPDVDLRQAYQLSPGDFQKILKALVTGKAPNGKPFTMKDAIRIITENQ